jgi:branched-chain amino acid transport system substrate-binding protein
MKQAASLKDLRIKMLLPGITVSTGPDDYFPIEQMQMQQFDGKEWVRFGPILTGGAGAS